jgi:GTP1/Obg family GTP-binding protein
MNALSAGVVAVTRNQERIESIKDLAIEIAQFYQGAVKIIEIAQFYQGAVKIEVNIDRLKDIAKLNITEYNL